MGHVVWLYGNMGANSEHNQRISATHMCIGEDKLIGTWDRGFQSSLLVTSLLGLSVLLQSLAIWLILSSNLLFCSSLPDFSLLSFSTFPSQPSSSSSSSPSASSSSPSSPPLFYLLLLLLLCLYRNQKNSPYYFIGLCKCTTVLTYIFLYII